MKYYRTTCGVLVLGLLISSIGGLPPPCEVQANLQPSAESITTGPVAQSRAETNRITVEAADALVLPVGEVWFDKAPKLKSGATIQGTGQQRTILRQQFTVGPYPSNVTLGAPNDSIGHVDKFTHGRSGYINVPAEVAAHYSPGTLIYCWQNISRPDDTFVWPSPVRERRIVMERSGNSVRLDSPIDPRCDVSKWLKDSSPINDVIEGASFVTTIRGTWPLGQWVLITDGPKIGNEANGELRRVHSTVGPVVKLDKPLRRSYSLAALAKITPVENVTLRDLTLDLPVNAGSESLYASFGANWRIERCTIRKTALGNCTGLRFTDCDLGGIQFAASSHDCSILNSRIGSVNYEEGTHDCVIDGCTLGPVGPHMNCVTINAMSERLTVRDSSLLGGSSPSSQILMFIPGRECVFDGLRMSGGTPCWLKGDSMRLTGIWSDGDMGHNGTGLSASQVRFANWSRWSQ